VAAEYLDDSHNASAKARERMYQPLDPMPKMLQEKMKEKIGVILTTF